MRRRPPLLLFFPVCLIHCAATAQQAPEPPIQQVEIKGPGAQDLRRNDSLGRIVVGRDELAKYGDTTLADALKRQPGVSVSAGEIRMRGLGAGYTQILVDGDPAPSGFAIDTLSPDLVERIEILRSASADTSAQAVAGTINIVLRKARAGTGTSARSLKLTAEQAQRRASPAATAQWSGRSGITSYALAATASQTRRHDDPAIDERADSGAGTTLRHFDERDDSRLTKLSLAPRMERKDAGGDTLALTGLFDLSRNRSVARQLETTLLGQPTASPDATARAAYDTWLAKSDLAWSRRIGDGRLSLKAGLEANRRPGDYLFRGIDAGGTPWFERAVTSSANEGRAATSGKYVTPLVDGHDVAFGWDAALTRRNETRLQQDRAPGAAPYYTLDQDYTAKVQRLALFAQDEWQLRPGLQAYLGLRWEGLDTRIEGGDVEGPAFTSRPVRASVFSPIGQLVWKLPGRPRDQLRLALARTYKAPQPSALVPRRYTVNNDNGPANPDFEGNPTLRPELAWGLDAALESYFARDGMASFSVYARRIRDVVLQRLYQDGATWVTTPSNNGGASVHGIEADLRLPLPAPAPRWPAYWPAIELRANLGRNWSHVDALPGPDNRLAAQAPFTLNLGADARFAGDAHKLAAGLNLHVVGTNTARVAPSLTTVSGMVRELEAYAAWSAAGAQWRLTLPDLLQRPRRESQVYRDAALFEQRIVATPRRAALRLQVETPM